MKTQRKLNGEARKRILLDYGARFHFFSRHEFGGTLSPSHPKTARPHNRKHPTHVIFRSFRIFDSKERRLVKSVISKLSYSLNVKVKNTQIVGDTIQLIVIFPNAERMANYFRAAAGLIARRLLNAEKGSPSKSKGEVWRFRPFTRVLLSIHSAFALKPSLPMIALGLLPANGRKYLNSS